ncbi:MAG TPA: hypothetical protein PLO59_01805, partial [Bacteroidia bacterium]|nr:hypothetical protein [Bacteroidia bacterium]
MNNTGTATLLQTIVEILNNNTNETLMQLELNSLAAYCSDGMEHDSEKFLAAILIHAINRKFNPELLNNNIYDKQYEVSQIELFDILIDKFPFVKYGQQMVNNSIIETMSHYDEVTLVDIGIGLGTQMVNIISMASGLSNLKKVTIVGIEPFEDALNIAEANIKAIKNTAHFEIEIVKIADYAENVNFNSIPKLQGAVIVNASLALHHIQQKAQRLVTLQRIKAINPVAFFITEPNVDHFEPDYKQRINNCYHHFIALFKVIDNLDIERKYKNGLKLFFGREIED